MFLEVKNITKDFPVESGVFRRESGVVKALDNVSFSLGEFETLGIVGESGSGKTTLAKIIMKLLPATSGDICFDASRIGNLRKDVQIIFQNPYNSLDPKMRILDAIAEPLIIHRICPGKMIKKTVTGLLGMVGLDESALYRLPREFSGGERQRICIARVLAVEPKCIILDEPVSSLDLTIQAKLLDLFMDLKKKFNLTYIFVSHNLAVVKNITDFVLVMKDGRIVEQGRTADIFREPGREYTKMLLEAAKVEG
ncbi:MAG: ATP-binding cassette domain-containing protein [Candidatus Omnitrophica bacterium]|nr:ATP-binding cassette domain-containing protein [Candidatus Omnitrophota bacterium]